MADDQGAINNPIVERVPYNLSVATTDPGSTVAYAQVNARSQPNGEDFHVHFDTTQRESLISRKFLENHFPSSRVTAHILPPADERDADTDLSSIVGSTNIAIYIPGTLEIPIGLRAMSNVTYQFVQKTFQLDLQIRVSNDGAQPGSLIVGLADMNCFSLALCAVERALILRPNNDLATRGIMSLVDEEEPQVNGVHAA